MNNEIQVFENAEFGSIRTIEIDGDVWFVGKDIAVALAYSEPHKAVKRHVDEDDRMKHPVTDNTGRKQDSWIINESGLYSLILSSKLPSAKDFKRWVTSDVLPTIRKHGVYATEDLLNNPEFVIKALTALKEEQTKRKALESEVAVNQKKIDEMQTKVNYYDTVLHCDDLFSTTEIAKDYGKSAKWLNNVLHELKIQFKQGGVWFLYQDYAKEGYACSQTELYEGKDGEVHSRVHTYWTPKGRIFVYRLLKEEGILPLTERQYKSS
ncbi:phage antirepressor [bacterium]|nr:phage antirepressor [bacterium]